MAVPRRRHAEGGFLLLEVLVALLIFAIGVLSLVGLQVASVRQSGDAKFRADATLLADDLIGRMWVGDRSFANLSANYVEGGTEYENWMPAVRAALPDVDTEPPEVTIESVPGGPLGTEPSSRVTVVISWKLPTEPEDDPRHTVTVVTQIK